MPERTQMAHTESPSAAKSRQHATPRPSASILLLSPTNQVLLLQRVSTSSSFSSAHVFPGGNLSEFHDGKVPPPDDVKRHEDSLPYRISAIRETFEESGILLARDGSHRGALLNLPVIERDKARQSIYESKISFTDWLKTVGGVADTDNLIPFTRWITPPTQPKRFTTQMYIHMLPLATENDTVIAAAQHDAMVPTPDNGNEVTTAHFDDAGTWIARAQKGEVLLYPPQFFLLHLLSRFLTGAPDAQLGPSETREYYRAQRERLRGFLDTVPTATEPQAARHATAQIPWSQKVISPVTLGIREQDQRAILGLHSPGSELKGSLKGGDWERVVLVKFGTGRVANVEVRGRQEVLAEQRTAEKQESKSKL
ncbi:hypothetical protein F5Y15DRAFT_416482 [Xylariaceae sp. FL0016]|nr:hypothetical protein F5Y15DRAFT_416482 [Xylariaceae sp. FL0016]